MTNSEFENIESRYDIGEDLNSDDWNDLFTFLKTGSPDIQLRAALILSDGQPDIIDQLLSIFHELPQALQKQLTAFLMTAKIVTPYVFFLDLLDSSIDDVFAEFITISLSKAEYFIFPLILVRLDHPNPNYVDRMKRILAGQGFQTIKPALSLFPNLPHEDIFREIFGHDAINSITHDSFPSAAP